MIKFLQQSQILPDELAHLDCDDNRRFCPAWDKDTRKPKGLDTVEATQAEAGFISELAAIRCCQTRRSFIYDGTLRNAAWNLEFMKVLKKLCPNGLDIVIVLVETNLEVAKERVAERAKLTGRQVQANVVEEANKAARLSADTLEKSGGRESRGPHPEQRHPRQARRAFRPERLHVGRTLWTPPARCW
eukprot:SRR837773.10850.p1 GENE.SRR837773.10850~~SRR837773.10850.p1  ORF type:complete len:188 (+),score=29.77 SRR837773.10850:121-684(+)